MARHRVLVVGVGSIGERHLRCFGRTERADLSFCETNESLRRAIAERYGVTRHYASLEEALADGTARFDGAVVATPAPLHIPMATQLAKAGVNLLIEKPLSTSTDGVDALQAIVREKKLAAMVAFTYRSHPALQDMRRAIAEGRFGRPIQVVGSFGQFFPKYRPAYREIYYRSHAMGGGAIQDLLPHVINAGEYLVGPIDRVLADAGHQLLEGVEVEDTVHVIARHGGVMGCYTVNQTQTPNENVVTVICERGTARFELHNARWLSMSEAGGEWKVEYAFSLERDDIFVNQANIFLDVIEGKAQPPCTIEEGLQTLRVCLAVFAHAFRPSWIPVRSA